MAKSSTALPDAQASAVEVFRRRRGMLRMSEAVAEGIHRRTLYALRDAGVIEPLSRGLFRLVGAEPLGNPDLVTVALRCPRGVVCLISALALHELTTQIPHEIYLAIPRDSEPPRIDYPPVRSFRFGPAAFEAGVESRLIDGVEVNVYGREKTLADCFKFRNEVGLETVLEALRRYKAQGHVSADTLMRFASVCRVASTMRPYLEAIL